MWDFECGWVEGLGVGYFGLGLAACKLGFGTGLCCLWGVEGARGIVAYGSLHRELTFSRFLLRIHTIELHNLDWPKGSKGTA